MDLQSGALAALALGFLLGLKHATDADHVVAVSTIATEYRNAWRGIWVGGVLLDHNYMEALGEQVMQEHGFETDIDHIALFGTCRECLE